MMQQHADAKAQAPDALLLFRMGDFYELFFDDARQAARILGLTLTSREKGPNAVPMAGFPWHSLDGHLRKLLEAGQRVAICEQVEDPKVATGLVERRITRIVTAGTLTEDSLLDPRRNNYLVAVAPAKGKRARVGLAWTDLSRGEIVVAAMEPAEATEEVVRLEPAECLVPEGFVPPPAWLSLPRPTAMTPRAPWIFAPANAIDLLRRHFGVAGFAGFGIEDDSPGLWAGGALLAYLFETQKTGLVHVSRLSPWHRGRVMLLDPVTRRSLELVRTMRENQREGSLLATIDRTVTAAGARCLADWLMQPLLDADAIRYRQAAVEEWKYDAAGRQDLRARLGQSNDIERLVSRISTGRTHPRDLASLRGTLRLLPAIKAGLAGRHARCNADLEEEITLFAELRERLERSLVDDPPLAIQQGGIIRDGFHPELDELRRIARGGKEWLADLQRCQAQLTGIPNLKVGFNKVFGYYLEVPHSGRNKVPADWVRRQTLKNAERYVTAELKEYEDKVLGAEDRAQSLEVELFTQLRDAAAEQTVPLQALAGALARLDALLGLAELAASRQYVRPTITDREELVIEGGRHPVLEAVLPAGRFVPNDTALGADDARFLLITGPNMAGKSTYIRQTALIVLLAQIGSFVPAACATIGIADRIFTRVGASDELARGQSTFMVEMSETANILHHATSKSLVILDEIGRGTSTYDGVSLAWAIAEFLHDRVGCRTLFATHYHELIDLENSLAGLRNRNVAVREWQDQVVFLHQIVAGGADRSYGIHVARLAGVPQPVLERARKILDLLERDPFGQNGPNSRRPRKHRRSYHQLSLFPPSSHPVLDALRAVDLSQLSPEEAHARVRAWQAELHQNEG